MANETVVEQMVVRLLGDGSSFQKMMTQASTSADMAAKQVEAAGNRIEAINNSLATFATKAVGVLGLFGMATGLKSMFDSANQAEEVLLRLKGAIEANGRVAEPAIEAYKEFADQMRQTTTLGRSQALSMLQKAESLGVEGKAAEDMVKMSVNLAAARGGEASQFLRALAMYEKGEPFMLRHLLKLRGIKDETLIWNKALEYNSSGQKIQAELVQSVGNRIERLKDSFQKMSKEIGKSIGTAISPLISSLETLVGWFNNADASVRTTITAVVGVTLMLIPAQMAFGKLTSYIMATVDAMIHIGAATVNYLKTAALSHLATAGLVGLFGLIAAGLITATMYFAGYFDKIEATNRALAETAAREKELADLRKTWTNEIIAESRDIPAAEAQRDFLVANIKRYNEIIKEYKDTIARNKALQDEVRKAHPVSSKIPGSTDYNTIKDLQNLIDKMKGRLDATTEGAKALSNELKRFDIKPESVNKIEQMKRSLQDAVAAVGRKGKGAQIAKMSMEGWIKGIVEKDDDGLMGRMTDAALRQVEALDLLKRKADEIVTPLRKMKEHLTESIYTFGMASREAKLFMLEMKGATAGERRGAEILGWSLDVLETVKKFTAEGKKLEEEFMSPWEKLDEKKKHLEDLYTVGAIGATTFGKALEKAEKAARGTAQELHKIPEWGSSEHLAEWTKFIKGATETSTFVLPTRAVSDEEKLKAYEDLTGKGKETEAGEKITITNLKAMLLELAKEDLAIFRVLGLPG